MIIEDLGHSLDHLRILTGETCVTCHSSDGEITPATEFAVPMYGPVEHLCARHYGDATEGAWERHCEEFYGGAT